MQLYRELRLKHWATGPPAFCRQPLPWCRAQILHTLLPADMSQWQVARDPNALCLLLLAARTSASRRGCSCCSSS